MSHEDNTCHHGNATTSSHRMFTEAQLQALIDQGRLLACYYAELDAQQKQGGDHSQCQPINFKGTEGVVGQDPLGHKKMESVFLISNCAITSQVKFASCTLQGSALTLTATKLKNGYHRESGWKRNAVARAICCGAQLYTMKGAKTSPQEKQLKNTNSSKLFPESTGSLIYWPSSEMKELSDQLKELSVTKSLIRPFLTWELRSPCLSRR
ncbi:hypothetical protein Tco_0149843 [Tanacetum coccineum]